MQENKEHPWPKPTVNTAEKRNVERDQENEMELWVSHQSATDRYSLVTFL